MINAPAFTFGEWQGGHTDAKGVMHLPWFELSEGARAFVTAAAANGFVTPGFDWGAWSQTPSAVRLMREPEAIQYATADDLARMLTTVVRGDRFTDGTLEWAFESGLIGRIVRRAADLSDASEAETQD